METGQAVFYQFKHFVEHQRKPFCLKKNEKSRSYPDHVPMSLEEWFPPFDCHFGIPKESIDNQRVQKPNGTWNII